MPTVDNADAKERIGRLETSVVSLREDFSEIRSALKEIQATISRAKETNWPVIFASLGLVGALYAAAIRPLSADVDRTAVSAAKLAEAVLIQNDKITRLQIEMALMDIKSEQNMQAAAAAAAAAGKR